MALIWSASHGSALCDSNSSHKLSLENFAFFWCSPLFFLNFYSLFFLRFHVLCGTYVAWAHSVWCLLLLNRFFSLSSFSIINMNFWKLNVPSILASTDFVFGCEKVEIGINKLRNLRFSQHAALRKEKFTSKIKTTISKLICSNHSNFFSVSLNV